MDIELWIVVLAHIGAAVSLCVRLGWRLRAERVRARLLVDLAHRLSRSGGGEFEDGRTRLTVTPAKRREHG
ncbi:hypothetical protein JIG36_07975 [Actinoplanes sp. LDG1-06]|uniref:Uncharacterized protein n=1 Tax=Paractinoplanes ovalisporus TaxID=2810368 RepID=A0ABS2A6M1_9ACTN|nr:hypothetical protein [Actinoplanes ovalisporus]MBM2615502.1 hypothetical protein [Actinoplanes ovalisporus]